MTLCSAWPSSMTDFSISVAVGQACTQAPQETHSESRKSSAWPADTLDSKPRPSIINAKMPYTSSQTRTQRKQTIHFEKSKMKYKFETSFSDFRWLAPS